MDAATWVMVGLIWLVQLVHYPMFAAIERAEFRPWHAFHTERITWIVIGPMLVELVTSVMFVLDRRDANAGVGVGLVAVIWAVTFAVMIPLHDKLQAGGFDAEVHAALVNWNWIRTIAWTARGVMAVVR